MVGTTATQNGDNPGSLPNGAVSNGTFNNNTDMPNINVVPKAKYTFVGIDIDTTGRRLIDEIVQLAAYTPKEHFEQYIMPYMNLNPAARQRHQVRVISIGFYRMLKSMQTYKIIKSKSEIAAIKDFLDWLEMLKSNDTDSQGIILIYHEERKFIPYMILESIKKYNLLDRFLKTVKSFVNGFNLAKASPDESLQHFTLRKLSKLLGTKIADEELTGDTVGVDSSQGPQKSDSKNKAATVISASHSQQERDLFEGNASVRAKLAFEVALQLSNQGNSEPQGSAGALEKLMYALEPYAQPLEHDLNELQTQNENLERQNSFRPVFLNYFKTTLYHRVRAVKFRIILAEQGYDLQTLNAIWNENQKIGLISVLQVVEELKPEDKNELVELFDSYFDPSKPTIKPIVKNNRRRNRRGALRNNIKNDGNSSARPVTEQGAGGDKQGTATQLPDSTTKSPSTQTINSTTGSGLSAGKPQRGRRNPRFRNYSAKSQTSVSTNGSPIPVKKTSAAGAETVAVAAN